MKKYSYSYAELRNNLRQVLDLADSGKIITIERLDAKWGENKFRAQKTYPITISCTFYNKDKRRRDNSNMLQSVEDVLVKAGILEDDNCWVLDIGWVHSVLDPKNSQTLITLKELSICWERKIRACQKI